MLPTLFFRESFSIFLILLAIAILFRSVCVSTLILILILFLMYFYRVPNRDICPQTNTGDLLAVSDGVVKEIEYNHSRRTCKVIVFLGLFDQHQQYYPTDAKISRVVYKQGTFQPAFLLEKSQHNERMETILLTTTSNHSSTIRITQIAGQIAQRIVNHSCVGKHVKQGEWMGMIKLSSRVDVEFSLDDYEPNVVIGQKIFAKQTILAYQKKTK